MAGHIPLQPPPTWVVCLGGVRSLQHPMIPTPPKPPPKPPDPSIEPASAGAGFTSTDGEGEGKANVNQLDESPPLVLDFDFDPDEMKPYCFECTPYSGTHALGAPCTDSTTYSPALESSIGNPAPDTEWSDLDAPDTEWSDLDVHVE